MKSTFLKKLLLGGTLILWLPQFVLSQFSGAVGQANSVAIAKDSSIIVAWATNCVVERGYLDIANPSLGFVSSGTETNAIGPADETGTVTLGDSGVAILTFDQPIFNGPGPDFVVFENAFNDTFLELAFVEVSSDGVNFFRFPATSNVQNSVQIGTFDELGEASKINNLAGKYRTGYGTPFDLEELSSIINLNINAITHVKIIDVVGSIQPAFGTQDQNGNFINDPYPTSFAAGGFDLDAVGVMYQYGLNSIAEKEKLKLVFFPNPTRGNMTIQVNALQINSIQLFDLTGKLLLVSTDNTLNLSELTSGTFLLQIELTNGTVLTERVNRL